MGYFPAIQVPSEWWSWAERRELSKGCTDSVLVVEMQSLMLVVAGCAGLVVNTVVLRFLLHFLGETGVLLIGR